MAERHGGDIVGEVLARHGVSHLFTLCGGHISPILVGAKKQGIGVVDCRDEKNAVFAADAVARLTGICGVAAVTAGPGVTNAITAIKNAQLAQSPVLIFGGATATVLKGRGSLQDIDQLPLVRSATKWATALTTVGSIAPTVQKALEIAESGVPGPVFIEVPVDCLYPEAIVKEWYLKESGVENAKGLGAKALQLYLKGHLYKQFHLPHVPLDVSLPEVKLPTRNGQDDQIAAIADAVRSAERPVLVIGSQTLVNCRDPEALAEAVQTLGIPTFLGGMGRGLLGRSADLQFRHNRGKALKKADVAVIAGFPFDFRMKYGMTFGSKTKVFAANLSAGELRKNRRPDIAVQMHAGSFLRALARATGRTEGQYRPWFEALRADEAKRDDEIAAQARTDGEYIDPVHFFLRLEEHLDDDAILVADGGDFVATASYIVRPRKPLAWLDPGVFGTLGVGGGFAVGAAVVRRDAQVWILWGDGSCAYSVAEFDTCVRHGLAPIAIVGTDASWAQIARDQIEILGDDVGTVLARTPYEEVAKGYGGVGLELRDAAKIDETLSEAKRIAKSGKPVLVNVQIARSDFRKGSISM